MNKQQQDCPKPRYERPQIRVVSLVAHDIIASSAGDNMGEWDKQG